MEKQSNLNKVQERSILDVMHLSNGLGSVEALERLGIHLKGVKRPLRVDTSKLHPNSRRRNTQRRWG